jgi:hypothetical protein
MKATFRPLPVWDHPVTAPRRSRWTFKAPWSDTLSLLDRELFYLGAEALLIQADFREQDIRLDGMPRSGARQPQHPGVKLSFDSDRGPLTYATDSCEFWEHNVRSIALGLEALRAVDRYGITQSGEQYVGFRAIEAASDGLPRTHDEAVKLVWRLSGLPDPEGRPLASHIKVAKRRAHPDLGGSPEDFRAVIEAESILKGSK